MHTESTESTPNDQISKSVMSMINAFEPMLPQFTMIFSDLMKDMTLILIHANKRFLDEKY